MRLSQLRRYDVQASYACALALISVVPFIVAAALAYRNYHHPLGQMIYGSKGFFLPLFAGSLMASIVPGTLGMILGWNSAGQRRNDKPARSWLGFFVGGTVTTLDLILVIAFLMLRLQQPAL